MNILVNFLVREITNLVETGYYKDIDGIPEFVSDFSEEELAALQEEISKDIEALITGALLENPQSIFQERVKKLLEESKYIGGKALKEFLILFLKNPSIWNIIRYEDFISAELKWSNMCFNLVVKTHNEGERMIKGYDFTKIETVTL